MDEGQAGWDAGELTLLRGQLVQRLEEYELAEEAALEAKERWKEKRAEYQQLAESLRTLIGVDPPSLSSWRSELVSLMEQMKLSRDECLELKKSCLAKAAQRRQSEAQIFLEARALLKPLPLFEHGASA